MNQVEVVPCIVMPNRDFLVGVLYGFNAAKKKYVQSPEFEVLKGEQVETPFFIGYWLELTCAKCRRLYTFDGPNEIPLTNLICETQGCGNHIVIYHVLDSKLWKIGDINFH